MELYGQSLTGFLDHLLHKKWAYLLTLSTADRDAVYRWVTSKQEGGISIHNDVWVIGSEWDCKPDVWYGFSDAYLSNDQLTPEEHGIQRTNNQ